MRGVDSLDLVNQALEAALDGGPHPPQLRAALRAAVFPGGGRLRPQLCLAVAAACGAAESRAAVASAAAVELLHCASLVHDDLPCFDDADLRRGHPSVHRAFSESLAVLAGDGLIVSAFAVLARLQAHAPQVGTAIFVEVAQAATHLVAGQGWESESQIDLSAYHHGKTVALFEAATVGGALAAGADANLWRPVGRYLGQAYQLADDLSDLDDDLPAHNLAHQQGPAGTRARLDAVVREAQAAVPRPTPRIDAWFAGLRRQIGGLSGTCATMAHGRQKAGTPQG